MRHSSSTKYANTQAQQTHTHTKSTYIQAHTHLGLFQKSITIQKQCWRNQVWLIF